MEDGHRVIEKKVASGIESLSDCERLLYCLWVADYGMCNAGDLVAATQLFPNFQLEGIQLAKRLELQRAFQLFSKSQLEFESDYHSCFDEVCAEISSTILIDKPMP